MTLESLPSATFSPESAGGVTPCNWQDGQQTDLFGQEAPLASPSARQESKKAPQTSGTYGRSSSASLESANLQRCLESKLRQQLKTRGSTLYNLTWKQKVTPQGWSYYQLAASAHRINATACGSWPTPSTRDHKGGYRGGRIRNGKISLDTLDVVAQLTPWATPNVMDSMKPRSEEALNRAKKVGGCSNIKDQVPFTAETENTAQSQLNPRFSLWLMGFPIEWAYCGERVTRLSRKSRRK